MRGTACRFPFVEQNFAIKTLDPPAGVGAALALTAQIDDGMDVQRSDSCKVCVSRADVMAGAIK